MGVTLFEPVRIPFGVFTGSLFCCWNLRIKLSVYAAAGTEVKIAPKMPRIMLSLIHSQAIWMMNAVIVMMPTVLTISGVTQSHETMVRSRAFHLLTSTLM